MLTRAPSAVGAVAVMYSRARVADTNFTYGGALIAGGGIYGEIRADLFSRPLSLMPRILAYTAVLSARPSVASGTEGLVISRCRFEHNSGQYGGSIGIFHGILGVEDSLFNLNMANVVGAAISGIGATAVVARQRRKLS